MDLDRNKQTVLDTILEGFTEELRQVDGESAVTLAYTHSLHRMWRTALRMLPVPKDRQSSMSAAASEFSLSNSPPISAFTSRVST